MLRKPSHRPAGSKLASPAQGPGRLGLVATPIGNLGDMTLRAIAWLKEADLIACEDTRVSGKLLKHFGVQGPMLAYHDHNAERMRPRLIERLLAGENVALISDAGTPLINDPGYKLVRSAIEAGIEVTVLPGASAVLGALLLSGLPTDRFFYGGFLPVRQTQRRQELAKLATIPGTLIFFETGPRLATSLGDMSAVLGPREAAVVREITKLFEEARRASLPELARHYAEASAPKGEIVVVVAPPGEEVRQVVDLDSALRSALGQGSLKDAVASVALMTGLPRRVVYDRALALTRGSPS